MSSIRFRLDYKSILHIVSHLIFWVWNLTFIGVMYLWVLPETGFELWQATRMGDIEPTFIVSLVALLLLPLVCTLVGFLRLRKYPVLLMRLFYGVEAPLFALCLLRLFLLRELTLASGFTLGLVVVAIAMFAIELLSGYAAYRPRLAFAQMIAHSLILLVGLYVGTLLLLYTVPLLFVMAEGLLEALTNPSWLSDVGYLFRYPGETLLIFLFFTSLGVFFSMPYLLVNFYVKAWARIRSAFARQFTAQKSWTLTGTTAAVSLLLFVGLQGQPQVKAFRLLAEPSVEVTSDTAALVDYRQTQLDNADAIRAGLTNAYLHRYRYLSPWSESNALGQFYDYAFNLPASSQQLVQIVQNSHNALISPFLYRGEREDTQKAQDLYAQFFDTPIQKTEVEAIRQSLQATANRDETKAGLLNLDQEVVYLASQSVTVEPQGDWATVEIHERYENPTFQDQEIFYAFSLPESAAITGIWLGDANHPKLFPFVVSPRGAAQQVYNGEVERAQFQRATDPALLEQVGPRQYRLRVFPIPATEPLAASGDALNERTEGPGKLELWMTYQVPQQNGQWPLPQLSEKRNIFWTEETQHTRGGDRISLTADQWFEPGLPAQSAQPQTHRVKLVEGDQITATPLTHDNTQLAGQSIAVLVDSSYSMRHHAADLQQTKAALKAINKSNDVDIYLSTAAVSETSTTETSATETGPTETGPIETSTLKPLAIEELSAQNIQFYGTLQPTDMLQQFAIAQPNSAYDTVLLVTDEGSYEMAGNQTELPKLNASLWMIHLGGALPSAYEDSLLQQLQASRGGVETSVKTALQRLALNSDTTMALDGYLWNVEAAASDESGAAGASEVQETASQTTLDQTESGGSFEAIAARQLIRQQTRSLSPTDVSALDAVHAIAKRAGIVTPYSSMIVLVDERQREALEAAEAAEDRFEREVEDGQDELTNPNNPLSVSVPEPGQVLSLMIGAIALLFLKRRSV